MNVTGYVVFGEIANMMHDTKKLEASVRSVVNGNAPTDRRCYRYRERTGTPLFSLDTGPFV